jgi:epoxyqueuosine reductase
LQQRVLDASQEVGAAAAGVAAAGILMEPPETVAWFAAGRHAGMRYLETHRALKTDPNHVLPGVRSIVCAAFAYPVCPPSAPAPAIAGYALGEDYHVRVRRALETVAKKLNQWIPSCRTRICVDSALSGAVLGGESRRWFCGHNGCLIVPGVGPNVVWANCSPSENAPTEPNRRRACNATAASAIAPRAR